jgi:hypothetical protein
MLLGSYGDERKACAPYRSCQWPENFDSFDYAVAIGESVSVYSRPDQKAPAVAKLSYHVVKVDNAMSEWPNVTLWDGRTGFVQKAFLRSAVDYRAYFEKKNNQWTLTTFVAGD